MGECEEDASVDGRFDGNTGRERATSGGETGQNDCEELVDVDGPGAQERGINGGEVGDENEGSSCILSSQSERSRPSEFRRIAG